MVNLVIMDLDIAKQLHRGTVRKFQKRRILTTHIDELWAADLLILDKFARQNQGYKYVLNVIDTFSKYLFMEPIKKKDGPSVTKAFEKIIKNSGGRKPQLLHVDMGKEFVNKHFKEMLGRHKIKMYHTFSEEKSAIAERVNRTINQKLKVIFTATGKHQWVKYLPQILNEYNHKDIHRTIGMQPAKVTKKNQLKVFKRMFPLENFKLGKPVFKIGDKVRIFSKKNTFESKFAPNWTIETFLVDKVHYTDPVTYSIKDEEGEQVEGKFYKQELLLTT